MRRFLEIADAFARQSNHSKHKMAAVLVRGGAVVAKATNKQRWGDHAERRALRGIKNTHKLVLYIARHGGKASRPCSECLAIIRSVGIKKIVYFDWLGQITTEKL